ncbi:hypothetical protein R3P38DRAFT_3516313 [Favolaschia claudopus]|uniref:Uncharacterized protein n=1 Tax=Favolaschia claudopus TaxID=2862362 RepID=A0AAW0BSY0_9AGAR
MAHLFPTTSGPNDPPGPQLSPEQWHYALAQFLSQSQTIPPTQLPTPPASASPELVLDPMLAPQPQQSTESRLEALEQEITRLKAEKRATEDDSESAPEKKRRKRKQKPSPYVLKSSAGLCEEQIKVRKLLMQKVKNEGKRITGRLSDSDSDSDDGDDESDLPSSQATHTILRYNFAATVTHADNIKVFDRIADLVWTEQRDPTSSTYSLGYPNVSFTREDLLEFAETNFRSWKSKWKGEHYPEVRRKQEKAAQKDRQVLRRKELKANRLKAVSDYKQKYKRDPICILETDFMSDEISAPSADDEDTRDEHRRRLVKAAHLGPTQQRNDVWEVIRPGFQSVEMSKTKNDLDELVNKRRETQNKKTKRIRGRVPRVNFGNTHNRIPRSTLYPFMLSQPWYDEHVAGNEELEGTVMIFSKDPRGFGDS